MTTGNCRGNKTYNVVMQTPMTLGRYYFPTEVWNYQRTLHFTWRDSLKNICLVYSSPQVTLCLVINSLFFLILEARDLKSRFLKGLLLLNPLCVVSTGYLLVVVLHPLSLSLCLHISMWNSQLLLLCHACHHALCHHDDDDDGLSLWK